MSIDVYLEKESGERLEHLGDPKELMFQFLLKNEQLIQASLLVKYLDPWGKVVFTQKQVGDLTKDLLKYSKIVDEETKAYFQQIIDLGRHVQTHQFLCFYGD